jgi:polyphosphate kinase
LADRAGHSLSGPPRSRPPCSRAPVIFFQNGSADPLGGRVLEHSRIYFFQNGSADPLGGEFYIGSADWMRRNLSERVEAVTPVEAAPLRARLWEILDVMVRDHRQAWDMRPDGSYVQCQPAEGATGPEALGTQQTLMDLTRLRQAQG